MVDILHRVGVESSSLDDVYRALTTLEGLSGWWASDTTGETGTGGVIHFRFEPGDIDMRVIELRPSEHVLWEVSDGPAEWTGTSVSWDLKQEGDYTIVLFTHRDWKEPGEFMHHCSTKWATFLMSLKSLLETGKGTPTRAMSRSATGTSPFAALSAMRWLPARLQGAESGGTA